MADTKKGHIQRIMEQFSGFKTSPVTQKDADVYKTKYLELLVNQGFKVIVSKEDIPLDWLIPMHSIDHNYAINELLPFYQKADIPTIIVEKYPEGKDGIPRYLIGDGNHRSWLAKYEMKKNYIEAYIMECEEFTFSGELGLDKRIMLLEENEW